MRIVIVGGGALGLLLAASLQKSGTSVTLVTRTAEQSEYIREHGIQFIMPHGQSEIVTLPEVTSIKRLYVIPAADFTLLTVKQSAVIPVGEKLAGWGNFGKLVGWQNGMGHMDILREILGSLPIYAAITTEGASRTGQNRVVHAGRGETRIGQFFSSDLSKTEEETVLGPLLQALNGAGFNASYDPAILERMWRKLIINSVINPLTALLETENGRLIESPYIRNVMKKLWEEGIAVAAAERISLDNGLWEEILQVCRNTYHNRSSMLQDIMNGRNTEISAINGFLVQKGAEHGLEMTANQLLLSLVCAKEDRRTEKGE